jgi:hypothetical protein
MTPTITEFVMDPQLLGLAISPAQRTLLKAIYGLPLDAAEHPRALSRSRRRDRQHHDHDERRSTKCSPASTYLLRLPFSRICCCVGAASEGGNTGGLNANRPNDEKP